jgi:hypothetical protein
MELTLENLVDEIVELEYSCYLARNYAEEVFGKESDYYTYWDSKLSVLYNLAEKFNFLDKLKRE